MSAVLQAQEPSARHLDAPKPALVRQFNSLATAPGGVARIRELILALAVQGKLESQNPRNEPANVLLHSIKAYDGQSTMKGRGRLAKPVADVSEQEHWFALPPGWAWARLGSLGDWGAGATPSRSKSSYYGGLIPWFKSGELTADFISESEETITDAALAECSLRLNQAGDVLIAMYGATIGKTAILSVRGTTNQAVCACTPFAGLRNTYLLLLLKALKPYFVSIGAGGAQPNISREKIVATVVGLPPLEEQARIVARVEELMRLCDALEAKGRLEAQQHARLLETLLGTLTDSTTSEELAANWQRVADHFDLLLDRPEAVDVLEQTVLQLAVRGLLVPQDPNDEPASVQLRQIAEERARLISAGVIKRSKPVLAVAEEEQPFVLPRGWEWARLEQLSLAIVDCPHSTPKFVDSGILCIDTNSFKGGVLLPHKLRYVDQATYQERIDRLGPAPGDLVFAREGSVGESVIIPPGTNACLGQRVMLFRFFHHVSNEFIRLAITTPLFLKGLLDLHKGIGAKHVNVGDMRMAIVPVPPIAEQLRVLKRVAELRQLCADLRQRLAASQATQSRLAEALVESVVSA